MFIVTAHRIVLQLWRSGMFLSRFVRYDIALLWSFVWVLGSVTINMRLLRSERFHSQRYVPTAYKSQRTASVLMACSSCNERTLGAACSAL